MSRSRGGEGVESSLETLYQNPDWLSAIIAVGVIGFLLGFATAYIIVRKRYSDPEARKQVYQINAVFLIAAGIYVLTPLIGLSEPRSEVLIFIFALASGDAIGGVATRILERNGIKSKGKK